MPDLRPQKLTSRILSVCLSLIGLILSVVYVSNSIPKGLALGTLTCMMMLVSVSGFLLFLDTRTSQHKFWVVTALFLTAIFGSILFFNVGITYTGSVVYDIVGAYLSKCLVCFPFAVVTTELLGALYFHTN